MNDDYSWADPILRQKLQTNPRAVLADRGLNVGADLPPQVVNEALRILCLLWVDGRVVPYTQFHIDPMDEGLLFGRGVWESTRTLNGIPWLWPEHLDRLIRTAKILGIPLDPSRLPDTGRVTQFVRSLSPQDVVVRLNVSAGRPGHPGMVWMSCGLRPSPRDSVKLKSQTSVVPVNEPYQTWKTFAYASRLKTTQQAFDAGFDTALMLSADGNVLEASHANAFFKIDGTWVTPSLESGTFLPGTLRLLILREAPIKVEERVFSIAKAKTATEAFVTNSNVGIVPVAAIDDVTFTTGPDTQSFQAWLNPANVRVS